MRPGDSTWRGDSHPWPGDTGTVWLGYSIGGASTEKQEDMAWPGPGKPRLPPRDLARKPAMRPVCLLLPVLLTLAPGFCITAYDLPAPSNVHIDSYNMKHVLRWDPVNVTRELTPVMYHAVYVLNRTGEIETMCINITETQCDFTNKINAFWRGSLEVQAERGEQRSAWMRTPLFQANRDTRIGPVTSLFLLSHLRELDVDFSPPFSPIPAAWGMKYKLYYWKESTGEEHEVDLGLKTQYRLQQLEPWTKYCVRVVPYMKNKVGQTSDTVCHTTTNTEYSTVQLLLFVVLGIFGFGLFAGAVFLFHKRCRVLVKHFLHPPFTMPTHMQEFLENPPARVPVDNCDLHYSEEICDEISLVSSGSVQEAPETCAEERLQYSDKT